MITIEKIKQEIEEIIADDPRSYPSSTDKKRAGERLDLLRTCIRFLETKPNEESVKKQFETCVSKARVIDSGYAAWCGRGDVPLNKKNTSSYNAEMGAKQNNFQMKVLKYLLEA